MILSPCPQPVDFAIDFAVSLASGLTTVDARLLTPKYLPFGGEI